MHVCSYLGRLIFSVFLASYGAAYSGTIRPLICGVDDLRPADIAGVYVHTSRNGGLRLEIRADGTASLGQNVFPFRATAGGIVRMAGALHSNDWPQDEFAFEGFSPDTWESVSRRYKIAYKGEVREILDISNPSQPLSMNPERPSFPWTTTAVVASLIVGGLVGRHYGMRSERLHIAAQSSR